MRTLQDKLRSSAAWHAAQNDHFQVSEWLTAAAYKIDELENAYRWIPIEEQMPDPQVSVFVRQHNGQVGVTQWWGADYKFDVTHWMPLPEAPKKITI